MHSKLTDLTAYSILLELEYDCDMHILLMYQIMHFRQGSGKNERFSQWSIEATSSVFIIIR